MSNPARQDGAATRDPAPGYRERGSQFPVLGALIGGCLVGGSVAGLVEAGGPNGRGNDAVLSLFVLLSFVGTSYLVLVLADLANGIEIGADRFTVGARGVPTAGRIWRRISGSLDAVRSWDVLTAEQVRRLDARRRAEARSGPRRIYLGDLRMFGRRQVLELTVDPAAMRTSLPSRIQVGYLLVSAPRAGAVWDGRILIGTRHPAALTAALDRALPGRRAHARH